VATSIKSNLKTSKEICPQNEDEKREMNKRPYRELVGGFIYLANATRSDIAPGTLRYLYVNPGFEYWLIAKRVLKYLKAISHYGITYVKNNDKLKPYSDSEQATLTIVNYDRVTSCFCPISQSVGNQTSYSLFVNDGSRVCGTLRSLA